MCPRKLFFFETQKELIQNNFQNCNKIKISCIKSDIHIIKGKHFFFIIVTKENNIFKKKKKYFFDTLIFLYIFPVFFPQLKLAVNQTWVYNTIAHRPLLIILLHSKIIILANVDRF